MDIEEEENKDITSVYIMPEWDDLTDMKKSFCRHYFLQGFTNAAEAARKAGSQSKAPEQIGSQWLSDPNVQAVLNQMRTSALQEAAFTQRELIEKGRGVFDAAMAEGDYKEAGLMFERFAKYVMGFGSETGRREPKEITADVFSDTDKDRQMKVITQFVTEGEKKQ